MGRFVTLVFLMLIMWLITSVDIKLGILINKLDNIEVVIKPQEQQDDEIVYNIPQSKRISLFSAMSNVESNNNPSKVGDNGKARGILQIHEICIREINNKCYGYNKFTWDDAFCPKKSEEMFNVYSKWIVENRSHLHPNLSHDELIARTWNGGYNFLNKGNTIRYWDKVRKELENNS